MKITLEGTLPEIKKQVNDLWPLRTDYDDKVEQRRLKHVRLWCDNHKGAKIDMIRFVRDVMDWSLYDSKVFVDANYRHMSFLTHEKLDVPS